MIKATRWAAFILLCVTIFSLLPLHSQAAPTAYECLENPGLEGCPSEEETGNFNEAPEEEETSAATETSLTWTVIKLIFVLLLVLGLIYGLLKFFNQKNKMFSRNRTMENLGGMNLAPNRSIQAVRIGEQVFILGVGDSVEMVTEVTDENTKSSLIDREEQSGKTAPTVNRLIHTLKRSGQSKDDKSTVQFQQLFEKQLNDMKKKTRNMRKKKEEGQDDE